MSEAVSAIPFQSISTQTQLSHKQRALHIVNTYALVSSGLILIPGALITQVIMGGILAKVLSDISSVYNVKLTDHKIKVLVASVLGGAHSTWISYYVARYIEFVPGINIVAKGIVSGVIIYSIGQLFIHHFESGAWR